MTIGRGRAFALVVLTLAGTGTIRAQEPPKPGPEIEVLKAEVGTWDATVEMARPGGQPPAISKGVETNTMVGGAWLITDFKSEMGGQPFEGHGVAGYDHTKSKYVSTWVDSMTTMLTVSESTYDPATKTMTGSMQMPDATGRATTYTMATEWKDPDTRLFTIRSPGPDGKDWIGLKITYTRRK